MDSGRFEQHVVQWFRTDVSDVMHWLKRCGRANGGEREPHLGPRCVLGRWRA